MKSWIPSSDLETINVFKAMSRFYSIQSDKYMLQRLGEDSSSVMFSVNNLKNSFNTA